jgi:ATP-dependent DNA helicase DinG
VYALSDIRLLFPEEATRGNWQHKLQQNDVQEKFSTFTEQMAQLVDVIRLHESRDKDIDSLLEKIDKNASELPKFLDTEQKDVSLWYETTKYHLVVHITPLSIAKQFENVMSQRDASWIFTSATLAIDGQFDHFVSLMGLKEAKTLCFDSPFDYKNQAMLC